MLLLGKMRPHSSTLITTPREIVRHRWKDLRVTREIVNAGRLSSIDVLDHVTSVITDTRLLENAGLASIDSFYLTVLVPIISVLDNLHPDKEEIVKGEKVAECILNLCAINGTKEGASGGDQSCANR